MANDRIYIQCRHCKAYHTLAKYYPSNYGVWWPEKIVSFIDRHITCSPNCGKNLLYGDRCFDLIAESSDEYDEKIKKQGISEHSGDIDVRLQAENPDT